MKLPSTNRLLIQSLTIEDGAFMYELMNSEGWLKFIGDRKIKSESDARIYILENIIPSYTIYGFGLYKVILKEDQKPIGISGLLQRDFLKHPDLGFAILPAYGRKGYTEEASKEILKYAKKNLQIQNIAAITTKDNTASIHLLKKMDFKNQQEIIREKEKLLLFQKLL